MKAPERILDVAVNSMRMGFESALTAESRALCALIPTAEARAAISFSFFAMQAIKSGKVRPAGDRIAVAKAGILGAGMMGSGIAWAQGRAGLPTVLKDTSRALAEKGKTYSEALAAKAVEKGAMTPERKDALLGLIGPTERDGDLAGCDLIVEAVFEDI
jgi:3-hydroxyacyl-CoA dehydrogenase / enoyl-CoA hydratase / 3-hydroxybutyryl-CoA epimerase